MRTSGMSPSHGRGRRTVGRAIGAGAGLALLAGSAIGGGGTLTNGDATLTLTGTPFNPVFSSSLATGGLFTDAGATDQLFVYGWYYRLPNNNQNRALTSAEFFTLPERYVGSTLTIDLPLAGPGPAPAPGQYSERFDGTLVVRLDDEAQPGRTLVYATLEITNPNYNPVTYTFFNLIDLDIVGGSPNIAPNDTLGISDFSPTTGVRAVFGDSDTEFEGQALGVGATRYEVGRGFDVRAKVAGPMPLDLSNNSGPYAGDGAVAFQWTFTLQPGQTRVIQSAFALNTTARIPAPCPGDANQDGTLDAFDFNAFIDAFNAGDPDVSDLNRDGTLDAFDFNAFVDAFNAGCP